jgi:hypothetical protein
MISHSLALTEYHVRPMVLFKAWKVPEALLVGVGCSLSKAVLLL